MHDKVSELGQSHMFEPQERRECFGQCSPSLWVGGVFWPLTVVPKLRGQTGDGVHSKGTCRIDISSGS